MNRRPPDTLVTRSDPRLPLYQIIRDALLDEIRAGKPGDQLPTEPVLMARFDVSRTTVRGAIEELVHAGLVTRKSGSGTYIAHPPLEQELTRLTGFVEDMAALNRQADARVITTRRVRASAVVAERLSLAPGEHVMLIERVRLADGEALSFDVTYLPLEIGARVAEENLAVYPIFELLEDKYGIALGEAEYVMEASTASRRVAQLLDVRTNDPILLIVRTTYAATGAPIDYEQLHYRGDRVRYRLLLKR
jgi:GntR family transcriptional regulator